MSAQIVQDFGMNVFTYYFVISYLLDLYLQGESKKNWDLKKYVYCFEGHKN